CPPDQRTGPICVAGRNQLAFKVITFQPGVGSCHPRITMNWLPRPACPSPEQARLETKGRFQCDIKTCERTFHSVSWHWDECKCRQIAVVQPAGKCCEFILYSNQFINNFFYIASSQHPACPRPAQFYKCNEATNEKVTKTVVYRRLKTDGQCERVETTETHATDSNQFINNFFYIASSQHPACPRPAQFYKCNEATNEKVTKTVVYRRLKTDGQCERVETTETHATACTEESIRRITGCKVKRGGDPRPYRNLVLVKSQLNRCICQEPSMQVLLEACMCPEAKQPAVRLIQQCPQWCHVLKDNRCDHRCQDIRVWQRFVYAGQDARCVAQELRRVTTPCCCSRNKQVTKTCDSSGRYQVIHITETELRQGQCVQVHREVRRQVQCKIGFQHNLLGPVHANGSRGMQTVYNSLDRCQCVTRAVQHQCITKCPDQRKTVECDAGARELVYTITTFIPVGCKCEQRVYKRRSAVLCPEQTKLLSAQCSPLTKIESRVYRRTFLDNCECREEILTKHGPCGCPKPTDTPASCNAATNRLQHVRTQFTLVNGECVPHKSLVNLQVTCNQHMHQQLQQHNGRVPVKFECEVKSGIGKLWSIVWEPVQCRCVKRLRLVREGVCREFTSDTAIFSLSACPPPGKRVEPCNPNSCLQRVIQTPWTLDTRDGQCHRLAPQIKTVPCCCPRQKEPPVESVRCNPLTGLIEITRKQFHFNRQRCDVKESKKYKTPRCPVGGLIRRGRCNRKIGFALDQFVLQKFVKTECQCRRMVKFVKRLCSCSHLNRVSDPPICIASEGILIKKHLIYHLHQGVCQEEQRLFKKNIVCLEDKTSKTNCNPVTCNAVETITRNKRVGCRCVRQVQHVPGKCCCPSPRTEQNCLSKESPVLLIKKTSYRLDQNRRFCIPQVDQFKKEVECEERQAHVLKRYCDRQLCHPVTLYRRVVPRQCQCVNMVRRVVNRMERCCCPPQRFTVRCYPQYGVVSRVMYRYELFNGHCITRKFCDQDQITCPQEKLTRGHCNQLTGKRIVIRQHHVKHGCECHMKIEKHDEPCGCPVPRILKQPCTTTTPIRKVFRLWFEIGPDRSEGKIQCNKRITVLRTEPCYCKSPSIQKHCVHGELVLVRKEQHLSQQPGDTKSPTCSQKTFVKRVPIVCNDESVKIYRSACQNHRRKVVYIRTVADLQNCRCRKQAKVRFEACACPPPGKRVEPCNPNSCLQRVIQTPWTLDTRDGQCHRLAPQIKTVPCCCPRQKEPPVESVRCNPLTGLIEITRKQFHFNRQRCDVKESKKYKTPRCPVGGLIRRGRCNRKIGFALDQFVLQKFVKTECQCRRMVKFVKRLCSCSHLNRVSDPPICIASEGILIKKHLIYHLHQGVCQEEQRLFKKNIVCLEDKTSKTNCNPVTCNAVETITRNKRVGCRCVRQVQHVPGKCCCPSPRTEQNCLSKESPVLLIKKTSYRLDQNRRFCIPQVDQFKKEVECEERQAHVLKRYCDRQLCHPVTLYRRVVRRQCQCGNMVRRVVNRMVLCSEKPEVFPTGGCSIRKSNGIFRPEEVRWQEVVDCKCVVKREQSLRLCACPEPVVSRRCLDTINFAVYRTRFTKVINKCVPTQDVVTTEVRNIIVLQVLFSSDSLVIRDRIPKVVREQQVQPVACPRPKVHEMCDPKTGLWFRTVTQFVPKACACKPVRLVKRGKCKCPPRRESFTECAHNFQHHVVESFELIDGKCVRRRTSSRVRCACPKPVRRLYCDGDGRWVKCYTQFIFNPSTVTCRLRKHCIRWHQQCPQERTEVASECTADTGFKQTMQRVQFVVNPRTCNCESKALQEWTEMCGCFEPAKIVGESTCEANERTRTTNPGPSCVKHIKVAVQQVKECRCQTHVLSIKQRCCVPEPQIERHCDSVRSAWITTFTNFTLAHGKAS
ncbi:hypothetical protein AHF37_03974, partial [Paragonimus kellicotti]